MARTNMLLTASALTLGACAAVATTRAALSAEKPSRLVPAGVAPVAAAAAPVAQAIPVSIHMPNPAMLPLLGAGAALLMRRRRT